MQEDRRMKLYVVQTGHDYEGETLQGVFTSLQKALFEIKLNYSTNIMSKWWGDSCTVAELTLNDTNTPLVVWESWTDKL